MPWESLVSKAPCASATGNCFSLLTRRELTHMDRNTIDGVLYALQGHTIGQLIISLLENDAYRGGPIRTLFEAEFSELLDVLATRSTFKTMLLAHGVRVHTQRLMAEISTLAEKEAGRHFPAKDAEADHLETFAVEQMSAKLEVEAPYTWELFGFLMESDPSRSRRRAQFVASANSIPTHSLTDNWSAEDE